MSGMTRMQKNKVKKVKARERAQAAARHAATFNRPSAKKQRRLDALYKMGIR